MQRLKYIIAVGLLVALLPNCSKKTREPVSADATASGAQIKEEAIANPTWYAQARCFLDGPAGAFDDLAVKDPSIVYSGGKYHLFYTGRDKGAGGLWRMGYA